MGLINVKVLIVCGGSYRRGKASCGDMDIVITHPDGVRWSAVQVLFNLLPFLFFISDCCYCRSSILRTLDIPNKQKHKSPKVVTYPLLPKHLLLCQAVFFFWLFIVGFFLISHVGFLPKFVQALKDTHFVREDLVFSVHSIEVRVGSILLQTFRGHNLILKFGIVVINLYADKKT